MRKENQKWYKAQQCQTEDGWKATQGWWEKWLTTEETEKNRKKK